MSLLRRIFAPAPKAVVPARSVATSPAPANTLADTVPARVIQLAGELTRLAPDRAEVLLARLCDGMASGSNENALYQTAEALATAVYPKYKFSEYARLFLEDTDFLAYYERFMDPGNWHSLDRKYTLDQLLKLTLHLAGDVAECGAYKGASAFLMCRAHRGSGRLVHLFDSFEGVSDPGEFDGDYWTPRALEMPEQALRESLAGFDNYRVYQGWIPGRFPEVAGHAFAFVHIDVDLYRPTLDSLEFFYERTLPGGVILMDDYGFRTCPGAKAAADEFFRDKPEPVVMLSTGQAFAIKR